MSEKKSLPIIHAYTREQAFADGVLVNLSTTKEWRDAGFVVPVACTRSVWEKCIEWSAEDSIRQTHQDQAGRLWDVLYMLQFAIRLQARRGAAGETTMRFDLYVVPRDGRSTRARRTTLKAVIGPGDYAEPVLTIMMPDED